MRILKPADNRFFTFVGDKFTDKPEPLANSEGENKVVSIKIAKIEVSYDLINEII